MTLTVATAGSGVPRTAHYIVPTGGTVPIQTLLLEPQRTNLCIRSEEFDTWTDANTCTVTANAIVAPDGTTTADLLTATATNSERQRTCTFTGDGEKCVAVYLKAGTSTRTRVQVFDATAAINRHRVNVTWSAGVPTIATESGSGTLYPVEALANGWYRILFSVASIVAANSNRVTIFPDNLVGTGSVYAWGAQAEDAVVPSSYIKTEATTITRSADSLYFPFTAAPQAMTVYVRGVERGTRFDAATLGTTARVVQISSATNGNPKFLIGAFTNGRYQAQTFNTAGTQSVGAMATDGVNPSVNELVELRGVVSAAGAVRLGLSKSSGAEIESGIGTAVALEAAWSDQRMYLNNGGNIGTGLFAFTHVLVAQGEQSLATMRQLAGVV